MRSLTLSVVALVAFSQVASVLAADTGNSVDSAANTTLSAATAVTPSAGSSA